MLNKWLSPWILVMIGIAFNIFAAVITNHFISLNNEKLHRLKNEISRIDVRINSFWQDSQTIERKKEYLLLFAQMGQLTHDPLVLQHIRQFIDKLAAEYQLNQPARLNSSIDSQQLINMIDKARKKIIDDIDDIYLDRIMLEKQKQPINNDNSRLMSIALFLQMFGLILVLAKDLQKTGSKGSE
jgi:hypothetical protein